MKIFRKATLHPCLENDSRDLVKSWCLSNISEDTSLWSLNSNYNVDGTFEVNIFNDKNKLGSDYFLMTFMLRFPSTKILNLEYDVVAIVEKETFNNLFETV